MEDLGWCFLPAPEPRWREAVPRGAGMVGSAVRRGPSGDPQLSVLAAVVQSPAESCCSRGVEPHLHGAMEELARPVSAGVEAVRSLFARRVDEMIGLLRSSPVAVLQREVTRERDGEGDCSTRCCGRSAHS